MNKVNEDSSVYEDSGEVCGVKEEMSKDKSLEIKAKVEVNEKSEEVVTAKPPDVLQRFDFTAKAQVEILDAKEAEILVNDDKAGLRLSKMEARLRGDVNAKALFDAMALYNFVRLYTSEMLVLIARNAVRFVDINPLSSTSFAECFLPILSDYG